MSVHRRKRSIAFSEFERQAIRIQKHTHERMSHVPKRYQKFICGNIYELSSRLSRDAIFANEQSSKDPEQVKERVRYIEDAIRTINGMQNPLYCYWNLVKVKHESTVYYADMLNEELALLGGVLKDGRELVMVKPYPHEMVRNAQFLSKIAELHRYTYGKIAREPTKYKDYILDALARYVDDALCYSISGNSKIPESKDEYGYRSKCFRKAVNSLNAMQRPLFALWNLDLPSEREMQEWSDLIDDSIKMLQAVINSDKERFGNLK